MRKVILGIGIPGSGKTTVLKQFASKNKYSYICPDDIRKEMTGDVSDQSKNEEVWKEAYKRTKDALLQNTTVVFDATFTNPNQRKEFIEFARAQGAEKIQGIYADIDFETALERNNSRERVVPEHAMQRMYKSLQDFPPEISDGFDAIFSIDEEQRLINSEKEVENKIMNKEFNKFH